MQYILTFGLFLLLSLQFCSCKLTPIKDAAQPIHTFFDLKAFFEEEARYLTKHNIRIHKKIRNNNQTEEHTSNITNWENELRVFRESDINKPSWKDKYSLDSTNIGNGLTLLQYKALDKNLSTQMLDIKFSGKEVHSILIVSKISNQVYESQQYLTYIPRKSYSIEKIQDVIVFDKDEYNIQAKYLPNES